MLSWVLHWFKNPRHRLLKYFIVVGVGIFTSIALFIGIKLLWDLSGKQSATFQNWIMGNQATRESLVIAQREPCPGAPFSLPSDGFIGLLYADPRGPYSKNTPHQGLDIFSPDRSTPGQVPVYAAYDGFISREESWRSTLIQRVPSDPLQPDRQIWLYYTHMADQEGNNFIEDVFPPGTKEVFVERGTKLGYTGNYNGKSLRDIWVHLHFSIVKDDGLGNYTNELKIENTIDPSPYLGLPVNYTCFKTEITCNSDPVCEQS